MFPVLRNFIFLKFISVRLFPANINDLPSEEKCTWWIPSAVKVLALLSMLLNVNLCFRMLNILLLFPLQALIIKYFDNHIF